MTFMYGTGKKHPSGWTKSDLTVCNLIALLGLVRLEVFAGVTSAEQKDKIKAHTIDFTKRFMNFTNVKQVLGSIKHELPQLLGYQKANIYLLDTNVRSLYAISLDEEAEKIAREENRGGFENEFIVDES